MNVRYVVGLTQDERDALKAMLSGCKHAARKLKRAQVLLAAPLSATGRLPRATRASASTIYRTKRRVVEGNLEAALSEELRLGTAQADRQGRGTAGGDRSKPEGR